MRRRPCLRFLMAFLPAAGLWAQPSSAPAVTVNRAIVQQAVLDGERTWRKVQGEPTNELSSRELFTYALSLAEAGAHPERLTRLFTVATQMQSRDPAARGYGNFRWSWGHADVFDYNAVDFCLQAGAILWLRHRDRLPAEARTLLRSLLDYGAEGLLRHRVNESYTNIALMNAGNLLLLGDALGRSELAKEGAARLDRIVLYMAEAGVHEYVSPTYYGVDLDDVMLIETFSSSARAREQARAIGELLWTDIALNWFGPAGKLAGARSRDYDYLRGLGTLDHHLRAQGWIPTGDGRSGAPIFLAYLPAKVSPAIRQMSERFPRLITQTWGFERAQTRTHYLTADVTLSVAGAGYGGRMDLPLTVDLPGPREGVRGYFIPDGRHDPYGKVKIREGNAHSKTLHLQPFWVGAQRRVDALGLVVYRAKDVPEDTTTLESHFVLPLDVDEIWVGGTAVTFPRKGGGMHPLRTGEALVVRKGNALVGIRVPWTRQVAGGPAEVALVCDAQNFGAMRLTVTHHVKGRAVPAEPLPGAAFWVRVGSGLTTVEARERWRAAFAVAKAEVEVTPARLSVRVAGEDGPVAVGAAAPFQVAATIQPAAPRSVLACDGDDIGGRIMAAVEPVPAVRARRPSSGPIAVPPTGGVAWEAEAGVVSPPMTIGEDTAAGRGGFVWMPAQPGERAGSSVGRTRFELNVAAGAPRYLWGRVLTPTPENDSFFVALSNEQNTLLEPTTWATAVRKSWTWVRFAPDPKTPSLALPAGPVTLELRVREAGARIDQLFLTTDPKAQPPR